MSQHITPPLAAHFIWHPDDNITSIVMDFRKYLTRDIDRPFSRELNIPTFLYSSRKPKQAPVNFPEKLAEKDIVFLFLSSNTLITPTWKEYIDSLPEQDNYHIIPVAVDRGGMGHTSLGRLANLNCVRLFDWDNEFKTEYAILYLSHELYRFGLKDIQEEDLGINSSIRLFLSHAKKGDTGLKHAEAIKHFLDNSNMQRFFDANEISPGFKFNKEIEEHIKNSTVIAIESDVYSSRYWCQREILSAKRERRPIILVNSLEEYEDRVFPAASNIPCVHITAEPLKEKDILRILIAALLETVRFEHAHKLLRYYQKQGWIDKDAEVFARPPEIQQIVDILTEKDVDGLVICYPDPPLYKEETEWTNYFKITVSTPLWSSDQNNKLNKNMRIGLSISDYKQDGYETQHQHLDELKRFSQSLARHLLANQLTLIYGGDLREDGFTQFILDEATVLRDRLQVDQLFVENYLAWPLHTKKENVRWYANYNTVVKPVYSDIANDVRDLINDDEVFLLPNCPENKYIWSRCLTEMRETSISSSDIRIFAGGKLENYLGKMPGVLEEFLIAIQQQKPIFLVGGLGGLTQKLCQSIINKNVADEFTEEWQVSHNEAYNELQEIALKNQHHADYQHIKSVIENISMAELAQRAGLTLEEYEKLTNTPFIDECVHLILKGVKHMQTLGDRNDNQTN
ncbi:TIR domain-containing protein [Bibersteinia trehalosi]|uniref:TIR domain-containing protein n=1 Tax=Bibersteinia trehalosi TaxID=47735 RepID=UPI002D76C5E8|nr:TIR domain-containing protein [Bibersteinia trehalosi]